MCSNKAEPWFGTAAERKGGAVLLLGSGQFGLLLNGLYTAIWSRIWPRKRLEEKKVRGAGEKQVFVFRTLLFAFLRQVSLQQSAFHSSTTLVSAGLLYIYPFINENRI